MIADPSGGPRVPVLRAGCEAPRVIALLRAQLEVLRRAVD